VRPSELSVRLCSALRVAVAVSLKVALMVRRPPRSTQGRSSAASDVYQGQVPAIAMPVIVKLVVPPLVSVTVFAALVVPVATVPKFRPVGDSFALVPIPLSDTCCGLPAALSVRLSAALRVAVHYLARRALCVRRSDDLWLIPARDFLSLAVWVASLLGRAVRWRDKEYPRVT